MSHAQKEYLKKWIIAIVVAIFVALMIVCIYLGDPWQWVPLVLVGGMGVAFIITLAVNVVASMVWHWRLMGVCENEWETAILQYWWRWMNYWGYGSWEEIISEFIAEKYDPSSEDYLLRQALLEKFKAVKAPRVLQ